MGIKLELIPKHNIRAYGAWASSWANENFSDCRREQYVGGSIAESFPFHFDDASAMNDWLWEQKDEWKLTAVLKRTIKYPQQVAVDKVHLYIKFEDERLATYFKTRWL